MKVTLNWLKDFVDIDISAEELAEKLTNSGNEVEEIIYQNKYLQNVVVGNILSIEQHPNAEKLVICQVDIGEKTTQIVTAAKNMKVGDNVPVSLPGAHLCNGIVISNSKLRGVDSFGMFCGVEELGVTDYDGDKDGIMILDKNIKSGTKIEDALCMNDIVLDVNVTANRPDCMSIMGLAREVCALLKKPFKHKQYTYNVDKNDNVSDYISVKVENTKLCPRYMATAIKNIKIEKSPKWLRTRLSCLDIKPINNIVDITNYVLVECGQPMHSFDANYINGKQIIVRTAKDNESIDVLNQNTYKLNSSNLCICDNEKPIVIAGIIGGLNSCVTNNTTTSIFESACFNRESIRKTSRKIGVRTDSTARFEKGVDIGSPEIGMLRALSLINELNCGTIVSGIIDTVETKPQAIEKQFSLSRIEKILGIKVPDNEVLDILNNLEIKCTIKGDKLTCTVPVYRTDIENDADVAEEIIRMYGYSAYDDLLENPLKNAVYTIGKQDPILNLGRKIKLQLCDYGYDEILNYSFCSGDVCDKLIIPQNNYLRNMIRLTNPISEDIGFVRTTLISSMLGTIVRNLNRKNKEFRFFEMGRVYIPNELPLKELPNEMNKISFASVCSNDNFYTLKGIVENILSCYELNYKLNYSAMCYMHPGISADIINTETNEIIGFFGQIHPKVLKNYEIQDNIVYYAELDLDILVKLNEKKNSVKMLSKFPVVERDLAIVCDEDKTVESLLDSIKKSCGNLYYDANLFDIYRSENIGKNKKSLAFNIKLISYEKTLTDDEINACMKKVLKDLNYKFGAQIR